MNNTNNPKNHNPEFDNDQFIYESMIDKGHTHEEACDVIYNLYHFGSHAHPDDLITQHNQPIVFDEAFWEINKLIEEMNKEKSTSII
jgi:hypothetical protein